jgi:putative PIN family toxin of toxin-antitoxin system
VIILNTISELGLNKIKKTVKDLPLENKIEILTMLEEELFSVRFECLLKDFRKSAIEYPITLEDITKEEKKLGKKDMRVVIDTNIWISYLIGNLLQNLDNKIVSKKIKIVVSEEMLKELSEVTSRPKFKNIFNKKKVKELFSPLDNYAILNKEEEGVVIVDREEVAREMKEEFKGNTALLKAIEEGMNRHAKRNEYVSLTD